MIIITIWDRGCCGLIQRNKYPVPSVFTGSYPWIFKVLIIDTKGFTDNLIVVARADDRPFLNGEFINYLLSGFGVGLSIAMIILL